MDNAAPELNTSGPSKSVPWVTSIAVAWCCLAFAGLSTKDPSWESLASWGVLPGVEIWSGKVWPLWASVFVHTQLWHVAANVYWLWVFGVRLERRLGWFRYLLFFLAAAFVSSSFQLAVSDDTGIGASGVLFAMYGFMLPLRGQWPEAADALPMKWVAMFNTWLVGCILVTHLKLYDVGNAAHLSGLAFGLAVGGFALPWRRRFCGAAAGGLAALAALFFVWCPWSVSWLTVEAYRLHSANRLHSAIHRYSQIIKREPGNGWALHNRASALQSLRRDADAVADLEAAQRLAAGKND